MKTKNNFRGISAILLLALAVVLVFTLSACGDSDTGNGPDNGPVKYTVTFNANGGTVSPSSIQVESGKTVVSLPTPTKTNGDFIFEGWFTKDGTSGDWGSLFTATTLVFGNITVYARWEELVARVETRQLTEANWRAILTEINTAGKYVNLDLSACTQSDASTGGGLRSDGTFDPISSLNTGKNRIVSLILPDAATSIANGSSSAPAFQGFSSLKNVSASAVTNIDLYAFKNCTNLTSVSFPQATTISTEAFRNCTSLTSVSFPQATVLASYAFNDCTSLVSVSFPATTTIDIQAFCGCTVSFILTGTGPLGTIEGGKVLVRNNTELIAYPSASGSITLNTITIIGHFAFYDCTSLTSVSFPQATTIGEHAFNGCTNLTNVSFPQVTTIVNSAFIGCTSLTSVSFPMATTTGSFGGCTSLTSVSFPMATTIGDFQSCTSLTSANFPAATTIYSAFRNTGTTALTINLGLNAPTLSDKIFSDVNSAKTVTVKVPSGATGYGTIPATYTGTDTTVNWGNGFRGGGWYENKFNGYEGTSAINRNITLHIQYQ